MSEKMQNSKPSASPPPDESLNPTLIYLEEFTLSLAEHFQAIDRYYADPRHPVRLVI